MKSLHAFCKANRLPKTSVRRKALELGFDTANGLNAEAQRALLGEFKTVQVPEVTIETGNHAAALILKIGSQHSNLEQFRTDRIRQALANPQEFITSLTGFLDQLEEGMGQAEAHQEQELLQVRQLKRQSQKRIEQFRRRADEYRIKTDLLASIQNAELDDLQVLAEETNALGKSAAPGQG
ncbi:hypothetical protein [Pseudanabaena sp. FACHB-2040]|uniref:hypothetical protein n=1 Tax=Pseudanabaena sp. FACHB-2040 TaxID=2692859 RepID=UPI0016874BA2|nr:hypothetical protein [Pseudanabaena sp. FACHB-2040]MBD2261053.1 hypothetical protein [Pseudanabaena sp. FACHB-2040]